jgi:hypothetical protein
LFEKKMFAKFSGDDADTDSASEGGGGGGGFFGLLQQNNDIHPNADLNTVLPTEEGLAADSHDHTHADADADPADDSHDHTHADADPADDSHDHTHADADPAGDSHDHTHVDADADAVTLPDGRRLGTATVRTKKTVTPRLNDFDAGRETGSGNDYHFVAPAPKKKPV